MATGKANFPRIKKRHTAYFLAKTILRSEKMRKKKFLLLCVLPVLIFSLVSCLGTSVKSTDPLEILKKGFSATVSGTENGVTVTGILRAGAQNGDDGIDRDFEFEITFPENLAGLAYSHKARSGKTVLNLSGITEERDGIFLPPAAQALILPPSGTLDIRPNEISVKTDGDISKNGNEYIYRFDKNGNPTAVTVKSNAGNEISRVEISNFEVCQ